MDLDAYAAEHGAQWRRLSQLSAQRRLTAAEVDELIALYQRVATHLSVVRSRSPDPALVARLSRLVLAAQSRLTGRPGLSWSAVGRFFSTSLPGALYQAWPWWTGVAVGFSLIAGFFMWWIAENPESAAALIGERPAAELFEARFVGYYSEHEASSFAFQLWTNNAWVAVRCLAAGILILPVFYLLWHNALNIGVTGGVLASYDRTGLFFSMIAPHGLLEMTGIFIAAGVGLRIGWAWIAPPPDLTRGQAVARAARSGILVAVGLVGLFAVAGLIEAFVTPAAVPPAVRVGIGMTIWAGFLGYVVVYGRRARAAAPLRVDRAP
ncbi:stage II sporulation protein M [Plantactinospora soyae]|uniref:Membrane protein SpoIIM required for sporulation n=1 Tax=Plantactinospora soyae TaxID=1544732 RepID=A0A927MA61_9ACTN|nr:stage II sporulation protein M [Plantactinospora soyae]MBE1487315.1 putative membrane protein SpoIIM required for sporulation [Plantactinospora soyae]